MIADLAPEWVERAACLAPEVNEWPWIAETTFGIESAPLVVGAFAVCATCEVRDLCLRYALSSSFGAVGIWGASTWTERRAVLSRRESASDETFIPTHDAIEAAATLLENTFGQRLILWARRAIADQEPRRQKAKVA